MELKRYETKKLIARGGFGAIYEATDLITKQQVAIKFESAHGAQPQLLPYEARVYKHFERKGGVRGVPRLHYSATESNHNVMVIDLLGETLATKLRRARRFSLGCVCLIADRVLAVLERVHNCGFVHRDIKPANFAVGRADDVTSKGRIYVLDFGLSKCYWDKQTNQHIPFRKGKRWLGTIRFSSVAAHQGIESSRVDDLQSAGFMFLLFATGSLPWDALCHEAVQVSLNNHRTCLQNVLKAKQRVLQQEEEAGTDEPDRGVPLVLRHYFDRLETLEFGVTPPYKELRKLFRDAYAAANLGSRPNYDWAEATNAKKSLISEGCLHFDEHGIGAVPFE